MSFFAGKIRSHRCIVKTRIKKPPTIMVFTGHGNEEGQEATRAYFGLRLLASQVVRAEGVRSPAADSLVTPRLAAPAAADREPPPGQHPEPAHAARSAAADCQQERGGNAAAAGGTPGLRGKGPSAPWAL